MKIDVDTEYIHNHFTYTLQRYGVNEVDYDYYGDYVVFNECSINILKFCKTMLYSLSDVELTHYKTKYKWLFKDSILNILYKNVNFYIRYDNRTEKPVGDMSRASFEFDDTKYRNLQNVMQTLLSFIDTFAYNISKQLCKNIQDAYEAVREELD